MVLIISLKLFRALISAVMLIAWLDFFIIFTVLFLPDRKLDTKHTTIQKVLQITNIDAYKNISDGLDNLFQALMDHIELELDSSFEHLPLNHFRHLNLFLSFYQAPTLQI